SSLARPRRPTSTLFPYTTLFRSVERSKRACRYLKTRSTASATMKASWLGVVVSPVLLEYRAHVFALTPTRPRTCNRLNERRRCRIFDSRETRHQATTEFKVTLAESRTSCVKRSRISTVNDTVLVPSP